MVVVPALKYMRKKLMDTTFSSCTSANPIGWKSMYSTVTEL